MSSWKRYELKYLCEGIIDCVNKTAPISSIPTEYKMLRTSDIRDGRINLENLNCVSFETFKKWTRRGELKQGDIVFTREAPLGEVGLVKEAKNLFLGQRLVLFRANKDVCDNRFLLYALMYYDNKQAIISKGVGSTVLHLRVPECEKITISAPNLITQRRIADILSAYDDLIENNRKQIKLLEEAAQRLYKEWFVDLRFPGHEHTKIVDGVPEGWDRMPVGSLIGKIDRTKQIPTSEYLPNGKIPVIDQSREFIAGYTNDVQAIVKSKVPIIVFGDHTRILKLIQFPFAKGADGTQLIISASERMPQQLLYCSLMNIDLSNYHYARHFKYLKSEIILLPSKGIADDFEKITDPVFKKIQSCRDQCCWGQEARDRLLPKMMSEEVEV